MPTNNPTSNNHNHNLKFHDQPPEEISEGRQLVRLTADQLRDETHINIETVEPLFGGELHNLWSQILVDEGDEIIVSGGTVIKEIFGGYVIDVAAEEAPAGLRADTDIICTSNKIRERIEALDTTEFPSTTGLMSRKTKVGELEVGIIPLADLKTLNMEALNNLEKWAELKANEKLQREVSTLRGMVATSDEKRFLDLNSFLPIESLAIRLKRERDNTLSVVLLDPSKILEDRLIQQELNKMQEQNAYMGVVLPQANIISTKHLIMETLGSAQEGDEPEGNLITLWTLEEIPRLMKLAAEFDVELRQIISSDKREENDYRLLYDISLRMARGETVFRPTEELATRLKERGFENVNEVFKHTSKKAFASACAANPYTAFDYMFVKFPFGDFVSSDIGDVFKVLQHELVPNNLMAEILYEGRIPPDPIYIRMLLKDVFKNEDTDIDIETLIKPLRAQVLFSIMCSVKYGMRPVKTHSIGEIEKPDVLYPAEEAYSKSMSEIMAMVFTALDWDEETDIEKIRVVIKNWGMSGSLKASWKKEEGDFDTALDEETILTEMQKAKDELKPYIK